MVPADQIDQLEADQEIISRVLGGSRNDFSVLIQRYSDPLYRHALGMTGSPDVAEDILQMSFIKAYQHLAEVRGRFDAWVFRIVANGCKDWLKNIRRTHLSYDLMTKMISRPVMRTRKRSSTAASCVTISMVRWRACRRRCERPSS
jgi:DNA-directed RNA polymerase specialized sigma24 family protein